MGEVKHGMEYQGKWFFLQQILITDNILVSNLIFGLKHFASTIIFSQGFNDC